MLFLVILSCGVFLGLFFSGKMMGFAVSSDAGVSDATADNKGFVAYCNTDSCVTLPTIIEMDGAEWQLGVYDFQGKLQLSYRSTGGVFMSVQEAFSRG